MQSCCGLVPSSLEPLISTNENWYCPINQQIYQQWSAFSPIAIVAVLIAFSIASLIVMVGIAFKSDAIRNFGIAEIYEAIASAIMVGIFLYICAVMFGLAPGVFVGFINPYATALNLMSSTINNAQRLFSSMFNVYYTLRWFVTQQITISIVGHSLPVQNVLSFIDLPLDYFFIDPARAISLFLADGILVLYSEYYLLVFFSVAAIPAFIVPGVIFRAFLPTRALGGVMLAIGISFYLVFPCLFAVAYYLTSPSVRQSMANEEAQITRFSAGSGMSTANNAASAQGPLALQLQDVQSTMAPFWLLVLFYPILIIAVVYATISQLSSFLGGFYGNAGKLRGFI
jgi:hypothetical protein